MIADFLKTKISKEELKIALDVLKEFKSNESTMEYLLCPFDAWVKFEQFEEYLAYLCGEGELRKDTLRFINEQEERHK